MPVYMVEKYVENSIMSVINQTYENIELICIDDASTDGSHDICERLSKKHKNIKLICHKDADGNPVNINLGQERTRNLGLDAMTGKYCMFLDSDDTITCNTIEALVAAAESSEADIVMFGYSEIRNGRDIPILADLNTGTYKMQEFSQNLLTKIPWGILSCVGSKLYRTDFIRKNYLLFDKKYKFNEDGGFILEALLNTDKVCYINKPYYKYLIRNSGSIMSSYRPMMFDTNVKVVELCKTLFINNKCFDEKKPEYYDKLFNLIICSLVNEEKFGDMKSFDAVCHTIQNYEEFSLIYEYVLKKFGKIKPYALFIQALRRNDIALIYWTLKVKRLLKTKQIFSKLKLRYISKKTEKSYQKGMSDDQNSRIYMFHNLSDKKTDTKNFCSNYVAFERFIIDETKRRKAVDLNKVISEKKSFAITFDDGRKGIIKYAYPILKKYNIPFTVFLTFNFIDKDGYLSEQDIRTLLKEPLCSFGSHTLSHPMLRYDTHSYKEIVDSKNELDKLISGKIEWFAYPYGRVQVCSYKNIKQAQKAGYLYAVSAESGCLNKYALSNKFFLPRINGDPIVENFEESVK